MCLAQALKEGVKYAVKNPLPVLLPTAAVPLGAGAVKYGVEEEQKARAASSRLRAEALKIQQAPSPPPHPAPPVALPYDPAPGTQLAPPSEKDIADLEALIVKVKAVDEAAKKAGSRKRVGLGLRIE